MLLQSVMRLGRSFVGILANRVEILALDLKEDRLRFVGLLLLGATAFFVLALGVILGAFFLVFCFWESNRLLVLGILMAIFLIAGAVLFFLLARSLRTMPGPFEGTLSELYKDREALGGLDKEVKR